MGTSTLLGACRQQTHSEDPWTLELPGLRCSCNDGRIEARLDGYVVGDDFHARFQAAELRVRAALRAAQLKDLEPIELSVENFWAVTADGKRIAVVLPVSADFTCKFGRADFITRDASGNVLRDTRAERLEAKRTLATLFGLHSGDSALRRMFRSFDASLRDAPDELIHLSEIAESFEERVADDDAAVYRTHRRKVNDLMRLANALPLTQGRHRGARLDEELRDATPEELGKARRLAVELIEAYVKWLDSHA